MNGHVSMILHSPRKGTISSLSSESRIFTASEGASRCSWSLHRFRVPGVMFISLQMSEAGRPPSCYWTARIRASLGWCLCAILGVFLVILVLL